MMCSSRLSLFPKGWKQKLQWYWCSSSAWNSTCFCKPVVLLNTWAQTLHVKVKLLAAWLAVWEMRASVDLKVTAHCWQVNSTVPDFPCLLRQFSFSDCEEPSESISAALSLECCLINSDSEYSFGRMTVLSLDAFEPTTAIGISLTRMLATSISKFS